MWRDNANRRIRFHISTPLGIEPGSLMLGSKRVDHWTSGTVYECSEIAGSPQGCGFQTDIFTLESTWQYIIEYALQLEAELYTAQTQPRKLCICGTDRQVKLRKQLFTVGHNQHRTEYMWTGGEGSVRSVLAQLE